jgi:hypothetical protein
LQAASGAPRRRWLAPLGAAAAVVAVVAAALALATSQPRPGPSEVAVPGSAPPYYVTLNLTGNGDCCRSGLPYSPVTTAVVRATATGAALATITPPRPHGTFIGVTGSGIRPGATGGQEIVTFSARTGKLLHVLNQIPVYGNSERVLWVSPSGQVLIVSGT